MIRPSSLPALAQCPKFEGGSSEFADQGSRRHHALRSHFDGDDSLLDALPDDDRDGITWAAEQIRLRAPLADHPINFERPGVFLTSNFDEVRGTLDADCGPTLFDLKWRPRDYGPQLAAYSLFKFGTERWPEIECHILFAENQTVERYKIDEASARNIVEPIIERAKDPAAQPARCDYCGWCAKKLTCPAFNEPALSVVGGREDWPLEKWHTSEITDPEQMRRALTAVPFLRRWCDAVEYHADQMTLTNGIQIPGTVIKESKGKTYATDLQGILNVTQLSVEKFLKCATVRMKSSKDEPDKLGIVDVFHDENKGSFTSKAAAERALKKKIEPYTARGKSNFHVRPIKQIEEGESENA